MLYLLRGIFLKKFKVEDCAYPVSSCVGAPVGPSMVGVIDFLEDEGGTSAPMDITSSLLGARADTRQRKDTGEDDDDAAFISAAINKQNKKSGTEVIKKAALAKGKGKNKVSSGVVSGGGSFQSMGELRPDLWSNFSLLIT